MKYAFLLLLPCLWLSCGIGGSNKNEVSSPDGNVRVRLGLNTEGQPFYQAYYQQRLVIDTSYLGFSLNKTSELKENFEIFESKVSAFDETWEQPWGEEQFIRNNYRELNLHLRETTELKREIYLTYRVFDDGIGFRYSFPEQENLRNFEVLEELTEFNMAEDHAAWWIPAYEFNRYEYLYKKTPISEMGKVHTPVTFQTKDNIYISIHEAALKNYSSMVVDATQGTRLRCELVPYSREEKSKAFMTAPAMTPWRTIQLAEKPGDLITSYLILNLNEPNALGDVSWFKPGKYIGIWWEMHIDKGTWGSGERHAATTENTRKYIDFASEHGFDGVLVEGWNTGWDGDWLGKGEDFNFTEASPDYNFEELAAYAKSKGVYLVGHHETGGNIDNYERQMGDAFALLEKMGVKAVKTGYVEHGNILTNGKYHHGQAFIDHFRKVIQLAANHQVAVVAHEPIKDTGERRTYPNMISREGARGQEFNAWSDDGGNPPNHETILAFTRNLSGPMDFTPGVFDISIPAKPNNQVNTTLAKQLALYVVIYSPMQMACDLPEHYNKYPDAFEFIKEVGVDWETTKVLTASIGEHVTVARKERGTGNWFVGGITNEQAREVKIVVDFLDPKSNYTARLYKDAPNAHYASDPEAYTIKSLDLKSGDSLTVHMAASGGFALSIFVVDSEDGGVNEQESFLGKGGVE